ncbi:hypothetical protein HPB52_005344 [Rhipicephalus sanguineus]|uniref:Uncharacterized protein n=1 Tax=Rhipicephalus sanguineus TaxID=34632 RepID=A0A9D4T1H1_RHISA|nr:hypothetical protein HPB52_005344 [Rhipicephalus sanguineus]
MASTWELLKLAERMGLEGPEFRVWYEERMAREREERAAERKAKKEKLESELRAKREQLESERRALEWRLEAERRALERRLEVAMDEKAHLESQSYGQVVDGCSDSSFPRRNAMALLRDDLPHGYMKSSLKAFL